MKWRLVGVLGNLFIRLLFKTYRIRSMGLEPIQDLLESRRYIFAIWHARIFLLTCLYRGLGSAVLVSQSEDGEIIAQILQRQGHQTIRGSTTRGGARALAKMIRVLRENDQPGTVIPDGPQGPAYQAQPGVITLAQKTGCPIIPMTYSSMQMKVFGSWDQFLFPYPFTECLVIYGTPIRVPKESDADQSEASRKALEEELNRITEQADRFFGHTDLWMVNGVESGMSGRS